MTASRRPFLNPVRGPIKVQPRNHITRAKATTGLLRALLW
jgi:hypothetical protein